MIEKQLRHAAEEFVQYFKSSPLVQEFQIAEDLFLQNPEIKKLREEFNFLAKEFQKKQRDGSLTQEDINVIRKLQVSINTHPIAIKYAQAQQAMVMLLQDCNNAMSEVLGFNFSATAAPAASC